LFRSDLYCFVGRLDFRLLCMMLLNCCVIGVGQPLLLVKQIGDDLGLGLVCEVVMTLPTLTLLLINLVFSFYDIIVS